MYASRDVKSPIKNFVFSISSVNENHNISGCAREEGVWGIGGAALLMLISAADGGMW
jgi:hypothetical protein